jgi:hypothetical protein
MPSCWFLYRRVQTPETGPVGLRVMKLLAQKAIGLA